MIWEREIRITKVEILHIKCSNWLKFGLYICYLTFSTGLSLCKRLIGTEETTFCHLYIFGAFGLILQGLSLSYPLCQRDNLSWHRCTQFMFFQSHLIMPASFSRYRYLQVLREIYLETFLNFGQNQDFGILTFLSTCVSGLLWRHQCTQNLGFLLFG